MDLTNNSSEMKTVVETFLIEETVDLIYDNDQLDKWNKHVEELGLTGQKQIVKADKSPIPFMHMKTSLVNILSTLCPRRVDVSQYNITPIPVEILELVSLSVREGYFRKIQIWYDDKNPDPAAVGVNYRTYYSQNNQGSLQSTFPTYDEAKNHMDENGWNQHEPYGSQETYYLIGKWADVKHSFEELKEMATRRYISERSKEFKANIKHYQRELDDLELKAFEQFN